MNDVVDAFNLQSMGKFDKAAALSWVPASSMQGHLAHKKPLHPRTLKQACA